jgi:hypothetical protein
MNQDAEKIRKFLIKLLHTKDILKKNKTAQVNWGRNLARQGVNIYRNYSRVKRNGPERYGNVKTGLYYGTAEAVAPRTTSAITALTRGRY